MPVGDGVGGAGLHAVAAEDAAIVVDVIHGSISLAGADTLFSGVVGRLDVDTVGRAGRRAQEATYTFLQPLFVALQDVQTPIALLKMGWLVGVVFGDRGTEQVLKGYLEAGSQPRRYLCYVAENGSHVAA